MDYYAPTPPALPYAPWPRRMLSAVIDNLAISFLLLTLFNGAAHRFADALQSGHPLASGDLRALSLGDVVVTVVYFTAFHSWRGSTPGKMAARPVLVQDDGTPVTTHAAFVRAVALAGIQFASSFLVFPLIVNELRPLWDPRRQTFHDRFAHTVVVTRRP